MPPNFTVGTPYYLRGVGDFQNDQKGGGVEKFSGKRGEVKKGGGVG